MDEPYLIIPEDDSGPAIYATSYDWVPDPITGDESWRECPHHGAICEDDGWHSWCEAHVDNEFDRCLHVNRYLPYSSAIQEWGRFWIATDGTEIPVPEDVDHEDQAEDMGTTSPVLLKQGYIRIGVYTRGGASEMYMESLVPSNASQIATVTDLFKAYVGNNGTLNLAISRFSQGKGREAYIPNATLEVLLECLQGRIPHTGRIKMAAWEDVLKKAVTLYNSGAAVIDEQDELVVKAKVRGEHDIYDVIIHFNSADDHSAMSWACGCEWGFWAWQRQYDYRGRPCSHALAAFMLSKAMNAQELQTPVEFELSPTQLVRRRNQEQKQKFDTADLLQNMLPLANPAKPVTPNTTPLPQVQEQVPVAPPTRTVRPV